MHANRTGVTARLFGRQNKTPAEQLAACIAAIDGLSDLGPYQETHPPFWDAKKHTEITSLRPLADVETIRNAAKLFPLTFAAYRTHHHDLEAQNAARLCVLIWVLQQLYVMRDDEVLGPQAGALATRITAALRRQWGIRDEDVPIDTPYRSWCTKVTRNYRALPLAWRWV